ncbi:hypothetical protein WFJ11_06175 [Parvimonas micra]|uniref:hypothetical protein n=1 Tax=Parvimonas micra TaxID=33033 RepID=UPI0030D5B328
MVTIFSVMSVSTTAEEVVKKSYKNYEVKGEVAPSTIYISNYFVATKGSLKGTHPYNRKHGRFYYRGTLYLTSYQSTGDGYLAYYSGYVKRR